MDFSGQIRYIKILVRAPRKPRRCLHLVNKILESTKNHKRRLGQVRKGQARTGQVKSGEVKFEQVRIGQ